MKRHEVKARPHTRLAQGTYERVTVQTQGFVVDDRPDLEYSAWRTEPCMENCKDSVEITMRATFLDVTPEDGGESVMNDATTGDTPTFSATSIASNASTDASFAGGAHDPALIEAGEKVFRKCKACHAVGDGAKNKSGPHLNALLGRTMGSVDGFGYSNGFKVALEAGRVWDETALAEHCDQGIGADENVDPEGQDHR